MDKPGGDVRPSLHSTGEGLDGLIGALSQGDDAQHI